ncbi:calcineurin-like phosphoesterase [Secundilactobacillus pentosiphilus]|uniref:Calcineurin-like phosphoesterase n=1 Tax=Secundilactobacillus pentosiphilus TaxID=1714682 RepID=A0A1Z5IUT2_9LACO|nr:metallophosphoesterase [Secundilactobacillus pentosiphilus]GAX05503.1 calcineurin-like phosphoesterase [Secundilactobacillus pentosiphilus]
MKQLQKNTFIDHLIDGQKVCQSGFFTPDRFLISRKQPNGLSSRSQIYPAHRPVHYLAKLKSDGRYWLVLEDGYLCIATAKRVLYGHDNNPIWQASTQSLPKAAQVPAVKFDTDKRFFVTAEPLVFRTAPEWSAVNSKCKMLYTGRLVVYNKILVNKGISYLETQEGFLPYYNSQTGKRYGVIISSKLKRPAKVSSNHPTIFKLHGQFRFSRRGVDVYQSPNLQSPIMGHLNRGTIVDYTGKLADRHRGWLQLTRAGQHSYVPFMSRYRNHGHYFGREITGSKAVSRLREPWVFNRTDATVDLSTTPLEHTALRQVEEQLANVRQPDSIVIGLINDTHYDAHQSTYSQRTLHDLLLFSHFARNHDFNGIVMNGDLVDGNQPLNRTIIDTGDAVSALAESQLPVFITQGNHDDNSGFARYLNGYRTEQVMTEQTALHLRNRLNNQWLANQNNFYGKYKVPGTAISLIMLNTFDIRDSHSDVYFDRDYDDQPNGIHWTGILQNIRHSRSRIASQQAAWLTKTLDQLAPDEQVIVFTHDSIRSATRRQAVTPFWTYDWFANNQQGDFARIYNNLVKHRQQIIAVMSGHTHVDDWSREDGLNWITTTCDIADRRKTSRLNSRTIGAWDVLVINPKQRQLLRLRYGWRDRAGRIRHWQYQLFGDGTDTRRRTLKEIFKRPDPQPLSGNARYYQNQNKQVDQIWRGFRGYFDY